MENYGIITKGCYTRTTRWKDVYERSMAGGTHPSYLISRKQEDVQELHENSVKYDIFKVLEHLFISILAEGAEF